MQQQGRIEYRFTLKQLANVAIMNNKQLQKFFSAVSAEMRINFFVSLKFNERSSGKI